MWTAISKAKKNGVWAAFLLGAASASAVGAQEFNRFGLSLKSGEGAGPMGIQLAWNFSPHLQACIGGGGTAELLVWEDRSRTDSYFAMGKYYLKHLYFESGYTLKVTKAENVLAEKSLTTRRAEHGIPMYLGYEFGHRRGFYFSTAAGFLYVVGGGGRMVTPQIDAKKGETATSAQSGPSFGMSVGYYLW